MANEEVKLYGMTLSPFVLRVEWALKLKHVEYKYVNEDLKNKSPQLLQYNPVHKQVPVLVHNGKPICESTIILEYIDEVWKNSCPLLPLDPHEKAVARFWAKFAEEKCLHSSFDVMSNAGEELKKAVEELKKNLKTLEGYLEGKKFFGGDIIGLVDIVAGWIPCWLPMIEELVGVTIVNEEHLPLIKAWMHDVLELDVVKETMPPLDKTAAHMKAIRENVLAAKSI
ncbi:glutathione transferase GST 23-like [Dioscorea cayenensis subsp. rotundata]|uniref:glutathione transferase n=1 Tax=Dioscorea cayennensis subsp. rotundata TaxID=55577 RepID=A0AB40D0T2_DIOCR|nr:glutathione transferase GST 23-like [Dioscorea cayenensis subsp. rotundata]